MEEAPRLKPLFWVENSRKELLALPEEVVDVFGYALYLAQIGGKHEQAKPLKGFGSASVLEVVENWRAAPFEQFTLWASQAASLSCTYSRRRLRKASPRPRPIWI